MKRAAECVMECPHGDWTACTTEKCRQALRRLETGTVDAVHASPPCQCHTMLRHFHGNTDKQKEQECLGPVVQAAYALSGLLPVAVENVPDARRAMDKLDVVIACGQALGLNVTRHRAIGFNTPAKRARCGCTRVANTCGHGYGPPSATLRNFRVAGNGGGDWGTLLHWFRAMGYDAATITLPVRQSTRAAYAAFTAWSQPTGGLHNAAEMTRRGLCESIPPAYASHIITPRLANPSWVLDLFAGEGGASRGFAAAGATVIAVDTDAAALSRNPAQFKVYADAVPLLQKLVATQRQTRVITDTPDCAQPMFVSIDGPWPTDEIPLDFGFIVQRCKPEPFTVTG